MRKLNWFLLVVNLGVLGGLGYFYYVKSQPAPVADIVEEPPASHPPIVITNVEREVVTNQFHWGQLESEDYRTYIERLRSIGCPEQTIHDILIADLDKLYSPKVSSASGHRKNLQYWQPVEEELANDSDA